MKKRGKKLTRKQDVVQAATIRLEKAEHPGRPAKMATPYDKTGKVYQAKDISLVGVKIFDLYLAGFTSVDIRAILNISLPTINKYIKAAEQQLKGLNRDILLNLIKTSVLKITRCQDMISNELVKSFITKQVELTKEDDKALKDKLLKDLVFLSDAITKQNKSFVDMIVRMGLTRM